MKNMENLDEKTKQNQVKIFDTTLRDGEQCPGATMTLDEKLNVAKALDRMKVDVIEAGFAAASPGDKSSILKIGEVLEYSTICSLARAVPDDIKHSAQSLKSAKKPRIHTFISTSPIHLEHQFKITEKQAIERIKETVSLARSYVDDVEWSAMDATRTNIDFLMEAVEIAILSGATTINIPDTVGYTTPQEYYDIFKKLCTAFPDICFSTHTHDDLGMAVANSLAGLQAGARQVECTINGIGERAGNASLEEVVMAIKTRSDLYKCYTNIDTTSLYRASRLVSAITGFIVPRNKAIVGRNAFAHESGIHQDGMLKNRNTYEIMLPETVGMKDSSLVLGKHSGRAALKNKLKEWNIKFSPEQLLAFFENFKILCDKKKNITEEDILSLILEQQHENQTIIALKSFKISHNDEITNNHYASSIIVLKGEELNSNESGNGPLDALFKSIDKIIGIKPDLISFEVHSVAFGTDAQAEASISLSHNNLSVSGHSRDTDTMMASARAYVNAVNKLLIQGEESE